jgi:large conductance mechanosensitive channel
MENIFYDVSPSLTKVLKFILVQDPVKIAIGFVLGLAISKLFTQFMIDFVVPVVKLILLKMSKTGFNYKVGPVDIKLGSLIEQLITFAIFIILLYYGFVLPVDQLRAKYNLNQSTVACPYCTTLINPAAIKCPACTSDLKKKE